MSAGATRPAWPPTWGQFWSSHERRPFTPAYNTFLDSLIQNPEIDLLLRVVAWILRTSWGNWVDSCVNSEGVAVLQVDCARDLKLFDKKGEPDRRKVNPIFKLLEERNCIRFEGQEIVVNDNPLNVPFAESSLNVGNGVDISGPLGFKEWVGTVWREQEPARFKAYQKAEALRKKLLMQALADYKTYKAEMSETVPTNDEQSPKSERQKDGQGADNSSPTGATNDRASLYQPLKPLIGGSSASAFSRSQAAPPPPKKTNPGDGVRAQALDAIRAAAQLYGSVDHNKVRELYDLVRERDPQATADEITQVMHELGPQKRTPGMEFFIASVPPRFPLPRVRSVAAAAAGVENPPPEPAEPFDEEAFRRQLRDEKAGQS
jgi:hypothetical protein